MQVLPTGGELAIVKFRDLAPIPGASFLIRPEDFEGCAPVAP
jgi:hypothetical protein